MTKRWNKNMKTFKTNREMELFPIEVEKDTNPISIVPTDQLHTLLASSETIASKSLEEILEIAEDVTSKMEELKDRKGIQGGSMDGTSHTKFRSKEDGSIWMAKDYPKERLHRAFVDEFVSGLSQFLNLDTTMNVKLGRMNGIFKVFVRWEETTDSLWDDLHKARENPSKFVKALTDQELRQIVIEQVLDWLISNHDPHAGHFLRKKIGGFLCIDKAQAFKYIGDPDEHLSSDYNPNGSINGEDSMFYMPIYNIILPEIAKGNSGLSFAEIRRSVNKVLERIERMSEKDYKKALLPYA
ncbi:MAG: Phage head morphogenesis protein, SPP1 gp7 family [Candidatus Uhrbacteria bacterium GW2011_GWF2_39_13]|uniref:Phage head morphogenesis protein, SPP1 gp7 family n=1 Tax=Candidatus Uhrbacteria bacterium GW2011_GWF2_39_13 TaxID=1618995 RepID=A0A0G0QRL4_9BACT|nr:MAG: Phage head morphogenesis protein, SPP1 gp7 family [Candidatus Uhrbacteria bacterium GW2011_GWF2_39_13]